MKLKFNILHTLIPCTWCLLILNVNAIAQQAIGLSYGYESFPYAKLTDPESGLEDLEIQTSSWNLNLAFPLSFSNGKIMALNYFNYRRVDFKYRNLPNSTKEISQAQSYKFTTFILDSLSAKWSFIVVLTPGLASDFESDVSSDDFTFEAALGFVRKYSENFQLGYGVAYFRDFGSPLPLPFLYMDWKINPNFALSGIVPTNMNLLYRPNPKIDLGLALKFVGNRYHGNPDKFGVDNPQMKYSEGTISPMAQLHFTPWLHLNVEGGFAFYRNFEFFDGDNKDQSFDLDKTGYVRGSVVLGI